MPDLPQPVSVTDEFLAALHGVLTEIRDRLPEAKRDAQPGRTKVAEPAKKPPAKRTAARKS